MHRIMLLFLTLFLVNLAEPQTWHIETVDPDDSGRSSSLVLDTLDNPHISYGDWGNYDLKYAYWNGSSWDIDLVDTTGTTGSSTSLDLDTYGNPHISYVSYQSSPLDDLMYTYWNGSGWEKSVVDSTVSTQYGMYSSFGLDSSDNPHICFIDWGYGDTSYLKYARLIGTSWEITILDQGEYVGLYPSLAFDSSDNPHIAYCNTVADQLRYAYWNGSSWQFETVDLPDIQPNYSSLVLDSQDYPHIVFGDFPNDDLLYTCWTGSSWETTTVDSYCGTFGTSIALDETGRPHISYCDFYQKDLKYACLNGTVWDVQTVDSEGDVGQESSLFLDSSGLPHISYCDWTNFYYKLKYAHMINSEIEDDPSPESCLFLGVLPNPTYGNVFVSITATEPLSAGFKVFDTSGRLIREIPSIEYPPGTLDINIGCFGSGIYFCRMISGDFSATQRFVVIE